MLSWDYHSNLQTLLVRICVHNYEINYNGVISKIIYLAPAKEHLRVELDIE